jgi:hypothetical protein
MNNAGSATDVLFIAAMATFLAIGFLVIHYVIGTVTDNIVANPTVNSSSAAVSAFNSMKTVSNRLDYVIFALFIGMSLGLIITGYFVYGYPVFMFFYIIVNMIAVGLAAVFSNVWEEFTTNPMLATSVSAFPITSNLMAYLPYYTGIVGFIGIVVMFAKPGVQK